MKNHFVILQTFRNTLFLWSVRFQIMVSVFLLVFCWAAGGGGELRNNAWKNVICNVSCMHDICFAGSVRSKTALAPSRIGSELNFIGFYVRSMVFILYSNFRFYTWQVTESDFSITLYNVTWNRERYLSVRKIEFAIFWTLKYLL